MKYNQKFPYGWGKYMKGIRFPTKRMVLEAIGPYKLGEFTKPYIKEYTEYYQPERYYQPAKRLFYDYSPYPTEPITPTTPFAFGEWSLIRPDPKPNHIEIGFTSNGLVCMVDLFGAMYVSFTPGGIWTRVGYINGTGFMTGDSTSKLSVFGDRWLGSSIDSSLVPWVRGANAVSTDVSPTQFATTTSKHAFDVCLSSATRAIWVGNKSATPNRAFYHLSNDGGVTWGSEQTWSDVDVRFIRAYGEGERLYVAEATAPPTTIRLHKSSDGGASWSTTILDSGLEGNQSKTPSGVLVGGLGVISYGNDVYVAFAQILSTTSGRMLVYVSRDYGVSWADSQVSTFLPSDMGIALGGPLVNSVNFGLIDDIIVLTHPYQLDPKPSTGRDDGLAVGISTTGESWSWTNYDFTPRPGGNNYPWSTQLIANEYYIVICDGTYQIAYQKRG